MYLCFTKLDFTGRSRTPRKLLPPPDWRRLRRPRRAQRIWTTTTTPSFPGGWSTTPTATRIITTTPTSTAPKTGPTTPTSSRPGSWTTTPATTSTTTDSLPDGKGSTPELTHLMVPMLKTDRKTNKVGHFFIFAFFLNAQFL